MTVQSKRKARGADLIIPVLGIALTAYYFASIATLPWTAKVATYFIGTVLVALAVLAIVRVIREVRQRSADLSFSPLIEPFEYLPKRLGMLVLTIAYIGLLEWGGFTLTTLVFLYLSMLLLGGLRVNRMALLLSFLYAIGGYLLFIVAFDTRFPKGPFEKLMQGFL